MHPGDLVIIVTYAQIEESEVDEHRPRVVHVNAANRRIQLGQDPAEPVPGDTTQQSGRS
ncbi:hypothetical protein GCM10010527_52890 [Streptomyces drozdowiczii]